MARWVDPFLPSTVPTVLRILLAAQIFTLFLTGTKFIPGIANNIGPFEIIGVAIFFFFFFYHLRQHVRLVSHPLINIAALMLAAALLSLPQLGGRRLATGTIQTLILAFMFVFLLVMYNLMLYYQVSPAHLLRLVTYSTLVIGPWVMASGVAAGGSIQAAGPFRNRAHMANYMLSAFWLILLYNSWPGIKKRERWLSYAALGLALYAIAVSGRRSVYLSLIVGLAVFSFSFVVANPGRRRSALASALVILASLGLFYYVGSKYVPQLGFFQDRVGGISERLSQAAGTDEAIDPEQNFFLLQRQGVRRAFFERPVLGIGWGGFAKSEYSPTGHEVHSTPMRFLAELGMIGITLYLSMMVILLFGSLKIWAAFKNTSHRLPAIVLSIAVWSLSVSYVYNRHITERTFWLLMVVFLTMGAMARSHRHRIKAGRGAGHRQRVRRVGVVPTGSSARARGTDLARIPGRTRTLQPGLRLSGSRSPGPVLPDSPEILKISRPPRD